MANFWLPALFFVYGTLIGSFLNVVIYRTPSALLPLYTDGDETEDESVEIPTQLWPRLRFASSYVWQDLLWNLDYLLKQLGPEMLLLVRKLSHPGSHCGHCKTPVAAYDNLPVVSWFILKGRCRHCQQPFSFRYPFIEILTGLLFVYVWHTFGWSAETLWWLGFSSILWAIFWIDFDQQFIFNVMTYPSILAGIVYNGTKGSPEIAFWGILAAFLSFELIILLSLVILQKEGMGGGDIKLAMVLGAWLGPSQLLVALAIAFTLGSVVGGALLITRKSSRPFPFGPFLVVGGLLTMSIGENLWAWYINSIMQ